jgi:hypothetical protein
MMTTRSFGAVLLAAAISATLAAQTPSYKAPAHARRPPDLQGFGRTRPTCPRAARGRLEGVLHPEEMAAISARPPTKPSRRRRHNGGRTTTSASSA